MSRPTVVIRADASPDIGLGHVARGRSVVVALRSRGVSTALLTYGLPDRVRRGFRQLGCDVHELRDPVEPMEVVRLLEEAAAAGSDVTALVDHYRLDDRWETVVRQSVAKLVAIEDRPLRRHEVDLLIDANGGADRGFSYVELLPHDAQVATGHDYAMIDPVYAKLRESLEPRQGQPLRLLVQLGSDRSELVAVVLLSVLELGRPELEVDVVVPSNHPHLPSVTRLARQNGWRVHSDVESIWRLYAGVDLAIAAPGVSVWERCALGVPSVVIETTPMHAGAYKELGSSPVVTRLGPASELDPQSLATALGSELARTDLRERSEACRKLIDGRGADRVASLLAVAPESKARLRVANSGDEARLVRWSRAVSAPVLLLDRSAQRSGADRLGATVQMPVNEDRYLFLLEDNWGSELGFANFARSTGEWDLGVVMAPGYQDPRLVAVLVDLARHKLREVLNGPCCVVAEQRNLPPGAGPILTRLGFEARSRDQRGETPSFVWKAA